MDKILIDYLLNYKQYKFDQFVKKNRYNRRDKAVLLCLI